LISEDVDSQFLIGLEPGSMWHGNHYSHFVVMLGEPF
jgi:hypothetical protein